MSYDIVIRGGTVGTASDVFEADVAIAGETIAAIGRDLPKGRREIDAKGRLVLPGGVDAHAHIEQLSGMGVMNADTFESGTGAAAHGGTTTVIRFAAQHHGKSLTKVVADYHALASKGAVIDYAFHMILADPSKTVLEEELPPLIKAGHSSIKVFMTYEKTKVDDEQLLDVLLAARANKALVCVHAENNGMISWMGRRLVEKGYVAPKFHARLSPAAVRGGGVPPSDRLRRADRPAGHHLSRVDGGGLAGDPRGARARPQGVRRDLHAVPDA